jgi:hypothetical protein
VRDAACICRPLNTSRRSFIATWISKVRTSRWVGAAARCRRLIGVSVLHLIRLSPTSVMTMKSLFSRS